jgi:hypothetical protein
MVATACNATDAAVAYAAHALNRLCRERPAVKRSRSSVGLSPPIQPRSIFRISRGILSFADQIHKTAATPPATTDAHCRTSLIFRFPFIIIRRESWGRAKLLQLQNSLTLALPNRSRSFASAPLCCIGSENEALQMHLLDHAPEPASSSSAPLSSEVPAMRSRSGPSAFARVASKATDRLDFPVRIVVSFVKDAKFASFCPRAPWRPASSPDAPPRRRPCRPAPLGRVSRGDSVHFSQDRQATRRRCI